MLYKGVSMRYLALLYMLVLSLYAYSDADLDGVDDSMDLCPNTRLTDLVDMDGCVIRSIDEVEHHADLILGISYSQMDYNQNLQSDTLTSTAQVDYYYKNLTIQATSSYYSVDSANESESGMNDSTLMAYYSFIDPKKIKLRLGAGVILPTYDAYLNNNKTDYLFSADLSYKVDQLSLFGHYSYTLVNDTDVDTPEILINYQDSMAYSLGLGYHIDSQWYASMAYNSSESVYEGLESLDTASIHSSYGFDKHWFMMMSYAMGLSDTASDHFVSLRVGYYF